MSGRSGHRTARDPSQQPVTVRVRCNGAQHAITWDGRRLRFEAHSYGALRFAVAMEQDCRCSRIFHFLHNRSGIRHGISRPQDTGFIPPAALTRAIQLSRDGTRPDPPWNRVATARHLRWTLPDAAIRQKYAPVNRALTRAGFRAKVRPGIWEAVSLDLIPTLQMPILKWRRALTVGYYLDSQWHLIEGILKVVLRFTNGGTGEPGLAWGSWAEGCRICGQRPGPNFEPRLHAETPGASGHRSTALARLTAILTPVEFSDRHAPGPATP
jgi:hypothetical protein